MESFPAKDRGEFDPDADEGVIKPLDDPLEAAALRAKLKQQKMREARADREASKRDGFISKSVKFRDDEEPNSEDDEFYDSDAMVYDSEEEAFEES